MSFKEILPVILGVLKNRDVIVTAVAMLLVMEFARYVVRYRKKPPRPVKVKKVAPPPAPKAEAPAEGEGGEEEATEE